MIELTVNRIEGIMFGLEAPGSFHEDMAWSIVLDLFILRFTFVKWLRDD